MPIERTDRNNPRPLKPTLASTRTAAKTPLTPRLAVAPTASSTVSSSSTRTARTSNGTTPKVAAPAPSHNDVTPIKPFLSSNVTPRSSTRKSRVGVDSASSTPSGTPSVTPSSSRPGSTVDHHAREQTGGFSGHSAVGRSGSSAVGGRPRSTPGPSSSHVTPTPRPSLSMYNTAPSDAGRKDASSLFFHANDARPHEQPAPVLAPTKKAPAFFYADGRQDEPPAKPTVPSPPLSSLGRSQPESKFFHADSQPESKFFHADSLSERKDRQPILTPPPPTSPDLLPPLEGGQGGSLRPPSPTKDFAHLSYRKGASQVRPALSRGSSGNSALAMLTGSNTPDVSDGPRRRSSVASTIKRGHVKSSSLSSIDSVTSAKKASTNEPSAMQPSPLQTENRASLPDDAAPTPARRYTAFSPVGSPVSASPTRDSKRNSDSKSALEMMNELAANARRERKVLDLEISNSSLLAINRSLEKEVRKQKAELRRFRRMSRAGHFSADMASSPPEISAIGSGNIGDLSDMSEAEEEDETPEEEEEDPEDSESSFDEGALSPSAQLERDEAHRSRDEKRLQLDLSKHREMLNDSQKMNQSLKKCLGWTEQLIKDGQKALEYKVHVSDVKIGGRVLVAEDDDNDAAEPQESRGLLSPWSPIHNAIDALDSPFFPQSDRVIDRDSGIDLEGLEHMDHHSDHSRAASPTDDGQDQSRSPVKEFRPKLPGTWISYATTRESDLKKHETLSPLGSPFEERIRYLHASIDALEASS
ncbi:uncharacterized protein J4E78_009010 [Alternaria triticimaculans]|uniref:uncharacterized protein n=1 Tax=Alternaria triticimaculans TaxID=297637 RepID=UPI0020C3A3C2|nr:uncharacterized protein J4E78_009010 [Alternaria triticimaculans]KAI4647038.1 hypothetical protein J4E78_009010 [Alternaria triticimaculans]